MFPTENDYGTNLDKNCIATFRVSQAGSGQAGLIFIIRIFNYFIRKENMPIRTQKYKQLSAINALGVENSFTTFAIHRQPSFIVSAN